MALSLLLDAGEDHFGSRNVLLGVLQVLHQGVVVPHDTFALVGVRVRVTLRLPGLTSEQTPEVGAHLVLAPVLYCVALGTLLDKSLLSLCNVSHSQLLMKMRRIKITQGWVKTASPGR